MLVSSEKGNPFLKKIKHDKNQLNNAGKQQLENCCRNSYSTNAYVFFIRVERLNDKYLRKTHFMPGNKDLRKVS